MSRVEATARPALALTAPEAGACTVRIVDNLDGLVELEPQWSALVAQLAQPNIFATPEWAAAAWRHGVAAPDGSWALRVLVVERELSIILGLAARLRQALQAGEIIQPRALRIG